MPKIVVETDDGSWEYGGAVYIYTTVSQKKKKKEILCVRSTQRHHFCRQMKKEKKNYYWTSLDSISPTCGSRSKKMSIKTENSVYTYVHSVYNASKCIVIYTHLHWFPWYWAHKYISIEVKSRKKNKSKGKPQQAV